MIDQKKMEEIAIMTIFMHSHYAKQIMIKPQMFVFYEPLVTVMMDLIKKGRKPDMIAVRTESNNELMMQLLEVTGRNTDVFFGEFEKICLELFNNYVKKVHLTKLGDAYLKIDQGEHPLEIMKAVTTAIEEVYKRDEVKTLETQVNNTIEQISNAMKGDSGFGWGFDIIDQKAGKMQPGDLIVIAGRAGMGKTEFSMKVAEHTTGETAGIVSLEMPHTQLIQRYFQERTGISVMRMRSGEISTDELGTIIQSSDSVINTKIQIEDRSFSINEIEQTIYRMVNAGAKKIVVDYLQKIKSTLRGNRDQELGGMTSLFKEIAMRLQIPIILLCQVGRDVEKRADKRPLMSDLRESGNIEADADMVICLYRESYYEPKCNHNVTEIIFRKHRHGFTGSIPLVYKGNHYHYSKQISEWYNENKDRDLFARLGTCPELDVDTTLPRMIRQIESSIDFSVPKKDEPF